jgi:hypothetical protein
MGNDILKDKYLVEKEYVIFKETTDNFFGNYALLCKGSPVIDKSKKEDIIRIEYIAQSK